ncbi:acetyltransferase [Nannizzia gypsea CBS 118893]|uniref:Acetyltransferase n=1 Tax=Arthroderma gypseum (strain ATCC MYA-4604 / CBS 118893) TaxID=535722 RepID=E4UYN6_ARTGP|nr:acetyltransferase [Nannizzia gypsea CBS 118893]EFR03216.1 acetyltransferase [Nannizzia gypsea CBS 118893]
MKRHPKSRELRIAPFASRDGLSSMFSRVPLLHGVSSVEESLQNLTMGDHIPGLLIPIAFLSSLRTNLQISTFPEDAIYNPYSPYGISIENGPDVPCTPLYGSSGSQESLPLPSPVIRRPTRRNSRTTTALHIDSDTLHTSSRLTVYPTQSEKEITSALGLISESVSQQRILAVRAIISHPAVLAAGLLFLLSSSKLIYSGSPADLILILSVWTLSFLILILVIRFMVKGYLVQIQQTQDIKWLSQDSVHGLSHRRDEVFIARDTGTGDDEHSGDIVGVLVMRICKTVTDANTPGVRPRSARRKSSARWTGIIRAWTVRQSARSNGVGKRLLEGAIANCRLRTLDGPMFADDHAHSKRFLPGIFNIGFYKQDAWARSFLEHIVIKERSK